LPHAAQVATSCLFSFARSLGMGGYV
jgi:hypothetical protein